MWLSLLGTRERSCDLVLQEEQKLHINYRPCFRRPRGILGNFGIRDILNTELLVVFWSQGQH